MEDALSIVFLVLALGAIMAIVGIPLARQFRDDQHRYALDIAQFPNADLNPRDGNRWRRR